MHIIHCYLCLQNCHFQLGVAKARYLTRNLVSVCVYGKTSPEILVKLSLNTSGLCSYDCVEVHMKYHITMVTNILVRKMYKGFYQNKTIMHICIPRPK